MKNFFRRIPLWLFLFLLLPAVYFSGVPTFNAGSFFPDESWTGVLRIWTAAGTPFGTGSPLSWLNARAAVYEKSHSGVRIQFTELAPEALSAFSTSDHPPDGLIFTPSVLLSADGLLPLSEPSALRSELINTGLHNGTLKAIPIAMGSYFWICSSSSLSCAPGSADCPPEYIFHVPSDRSDACYSAALLALFTGTDQATPQIFYPGADLGLPQSAATAAPVTQAVPLQKPASFAPDIREYASVRALFTAGETDAILATVQELRRIEQLADAGRAPDYGVYAGDTAFTDLLAMAAVVDNTGPDSDDRERLCADFFSFLLTEESQRALTSVRAFRVTEGEPLYQSSRSGMAEAESALLGELTVPNAFDATWRAKASDAANLFISTDAAAVELFPSIFQ